MPITPKLPPFSSQEANLALNGDFTKHQSAILQVEGLNFRYPDGHQALTNISITIHKGEKVALVGPNGAGKSTLMLHLNGILAGQGVVNVAGKIIHKDNLLQVRAMVGLVFQNPDDQLFSPTVFEDVAFGPLHMGYSEADVREQVMEALDKVGMTGFEDRLSHHLSVGEKKRVAIATVLSMNPEILVLDEPTAGLDPRARRSLIELLNKLPHTILASTHDMRLVEELFPRMVVMDTGQIVADAPTEGLMQDQNFLEAHGLEKP